MQPETSYYDVSDTADPTHQDHGVASFNVLLDVCPHLDSRKLQIEDFLLSNGINNILEFSGLIPDDIPAMMTRKRKPPGTVGAVELEGDEVPLPGVVARAIKVLLWYVYWLYHTEFKGKDVIWSKLSNHRHYNEFRTRHYLQYQAHETYTTSQHQHNSIKPGSMVDRGAKGGVAGQDSRNISGTGRTVNVTGINDHQMPDLEMCTAGGAIERRHAAPVHAFNEDAETFVSDDTDDT